MPCLHRTRLLVTEPGLVRVVDVTLGALPSAVVWPPLYPFPMQPAKSSLCGVVAGLLDGTFYIADRGAAVVWSLSISPQVLSTLL